jgi:DNA-directed RNA polymerase specialized sigma24 family protein
MIPTDFCSPAPDGHEPDDEFVWHALLVWLLPLVTAWVYSSHVNIWCGQQSEIVQEIIQESVTRAFEYVKRARHNGGPSVIHLKAFCRTIARNLFVDRVRKEGLLVRLAFADNIDRLYAGKLEGQNAAELALDHLIDEEAIINAVKVIVKLPDKRRAALLIALANVIDLAESPSLLEQELAKQGIQLRDYVRPRSDDPAVRSRQAALLWYALRELQRLKDDS